MEETGITPEINLKGERQVKIAKSRPK